MPSSHSSRASASTAANIAATTGSMPSARAAGTAARTTERASAATSVAQLEPGRDRGERRRHRDRPEQAEHRHGDARHAQPVQRALLTGGGGFRRSFLEPLVDVAHGVPFPGTIDPQRPTLRRAQRRGSTSAAVSPAPAAAVLPPASARRPPRLQRLMQSAMHRGWLSDSRLLELYPPFALDAYQGAGDRRRLAARAHPPAAERDLAQSWWRDVRRLPGPLADLIPALACARVFPGYAVWTRAMNIDFEHGGTDLELRFELPPEQGADPRRARRAGPLDPGLRLRLPPTDALHARVLNTVAIRPRGLATPGPRRHRRRSGPSNERPGASRAARRSRRGTQAAIGRRDPCLLLFAGAVAPSLAQPADAPPPPSPSPPSAQAAAQSIEPLSAADAPRYMRHLARELRVVLRDTPVEFTSVGREGLRLTIPAGGCSSSTPPRCRGDAQLRLDAWRWHSPARTGSAPGSRSPATRTRSAGGTERDADAAARATRSRSTSRRGVDAARMTTRGAGESELREKNEDSPAARQQPAGRDRAQAVSTIAREASLTRSPRAGGCARPTRRTCRRGRAASPSRRRPSSGSRGRRGCAGPASPSPASGARGVDVPLLVLGLDRRVRVRAGR